MDRRGPHNAETGRELRRRGADRRRAGERGIVLLDVVLALAILLLTARIVWPVLTVNTSPARLVAWGEELAALIEADRVSAARLGHTVTTRIDVRRKLIVGGARGRTVKLPRDVGFDVVSTADCAVDRDRFALGFAADGRSCGLAATLVGPTGTTVRVSVDWLTGFVDVVGGRRGA